MKKKFLILFGFIVLTLIPNNVFASTTGTYSLNKANAVWYDIEDDTDFYLGIESNTNYITNTNNAFYHYYEINTGTTSYNSNNDTYYSPGSIRFYNSNGITPCGSECDLTLTFQYGFLANMVYTSNADQYSLATLYLGLAYETTTGVGGVSIHGIDIDNNDKVFNCNSIYIIDTIGNNSPYYKFIGSCPTSNFKRIDYIEFKTGWPNVANNIGINNMITGVTDVTYSIGAHTGTQDGDGTYIPQPEPTDDPMTDDNIDMNFQNATLDDINGQLATNNVISDLLLLPVTMYQSILSSLGSNTCTSFNLGSLYGTNLVLPCIQVQNYVGSTLWTTIDLIFCGMFVLVIRKKFVDIFNNMTSLKNRGNEIE